MANIPRNRDYVNDIEVSNGAPVTEALLNKLGANINDYLDHAWQSQTFTSNGTFNVPEAVTTVIVVGAGGGGGGGGGVVAAYGGHGGAGGVSGAVMVPVTPLSSISVTIGAAGLGGAAGVKGTSGGTSSFGTLAYFYGGFGGMQGGHNAPLQGYWDRLWCSHADYLVNNSNYGKMTVGGRGFGSGLYLDGEASFFAPGGVSDSVDNGGGGGGAALNEGGPGRGNNPVVAGDAQGNGGAGGGGGGTNALTLAGGNGSPGKIIVYWYGVA
jgi:hypothetical protein